MMAAAQYTRVGGIPCVEDRAGGVRVVERETRQQTLLLRGTPGSRPSRPVGYDAPEEPAPKTRTMLRPRPHSTAPEVFKR